MPTRGAQSYECNDRVPQVQQWWHGVLFSSLHSELSSVSATKESSAAEKEELWLADQVRFGGA